MADGLAGFVEGYQQATEEKRKRASEIAQKVIQQEAQQWKQKEFEAKQKQQGIENQQEDARIKQQAKYQAEQTEWHQSQVIQKAWEDITKDNLAYAKMSNQEKLQRQRLFVQGAQKYAHDGATIDDAVNRAGIDDGGAQIISQGTGLSHDQAAALQDNPGSLFQQLHDLTKFGAEGGQLPIPASKLENDKSKRGLTDAQAALTNKKSITEEAKAKWIDPLAKSLIDFRKLQGAAAASMKGERDAQTQNIKAKTDLLVSEAITANADALARIKNLDADTTYKNAMTEYKNTEKELLGKDPAIIGKQRDKLDKSLAYYNAQLTKSNGIMEKQDELIRKLTAQDADADTDAERAGIRIQIGRLHMHKKEEQARHDEYVKAKKSTENLISQMDKPPIVNKSSGAPSGKYVYVNPATPTRVTGGSQPPPGFVRPEDRNTSRDPNAHNKTVHKPKDTPARAATHGTSRDAPPKKKPLQKAAPHAHKTNAEIDSEIARKKKLMDSLR
jgi:hypothetical protein